MSNDAAWTCQRCGTPVVGGGHDTLACLWVWRAHAETLAEALQECATYFGHWRGREPECTEDAMAKTISQALARLPADALAERRAWARREG